jgi:hypothetical protein
VSRRELDSRTAVLGFNCVDPAPLVRFCAQFGITTLRNTEAVDRIRAVHGDAAAKAPARLARAIARGWIPERQVDEICCALGSHPVTVYGPAWSRVVCQDATDEELADIGVVQPNKEQTHVG